LQSSKTTLVSGFGPDTPKQLVKHPTIVNVAPATRGMAVAVEKLRAGRSRLIPVIGVQFPLD
jgi:hypothetical protein